MSRIKVRTIGQTATHSSIVKRATGRLTDGSHVMLVSDSNRADANGSNTSGTPAVYLYKTNTARTTIDSTNSRTLTNLSGALSSTAGAIMSMAVASNNDVYVAWYHRTDNSLRMLYLPWNGTSWNAATEQTIATGNAVTNRYRAIDIDVTTGGTGGNPVVSVVEAKNSAGNGAWVTAYVRNSDGTTWRKAVDVDAGNLAIRANSSDICVSWNAAGISSNVGQFALVWSDIWTTVDNGDRVREYSYNVSTGTDGSATLLGSWATALNKNQASGQRRNWLFKYANNKWILASAVGTSVPFFSGAKLTHNVFTGVSYNTISVTTASQATSQGLAVFRDIHPMNAVTAEYGDGRLMFIFVGAGFARTRSLRSVHMRWSTTSDVASTVHKDTAARIWDRDSTTTTNNYPVIGVYGGGNSRLSDGTLTFNSVAMYGPPGNTVDPDVGENEREYVYVFEDTISAPNVVYPKNVNTGTDTPIIQVSAKNTQKYTNVLGKLEMNLDDNSGFASPLTITQADSEFANFSSLTGLEQPTRMFAHQILPVDGLSSGTWYIRARVLDDLGGVGSWSSTVTFTISHPPVALPLTPTHASVIQYGTGNVTFSWEFTDPAPNDSQSAYQVIVVRTDTGANVHDTGKVSSGDTSVVINLDAALKDVPLQWTVTLWDSDDVQGSASSPILFTVVDPPTVVLDQPAEAATVTTALPTFQWTMTVGGSRFQRAFRIIVYPSGNPDGVVADSGWRFTNASIYTFPTQILTNAVTYTAEIHVQDNAGLSATDSNSFTTDWVEPALADLTVTVDAFKATLSWTDVNLDADFVRWFVYRRYMKPAIVELDTDDTANTWVLIGETADNGPLVTFLDYTAPLGKTVQYVVVQLVDRFGSLIESDITSFQSAQLTGDRYFFVPEVPIGSIASFEAANVTSDSFTHETERETLHVIGRGRQVQLGDDLGYSGSLTIRLINTATARRDREFFERLASSDTGNVYLKSPFGDVLYVAFGDPSFSRRPGSGTSDLGDLTITYVEVFGDVPITRAG